LEGDDEDEVAEVRKELTKAIKAIEDLEEFFATVKKGPVNASLAISAAHRLWC